MAGQTKPFTDVTATFAPTDEEWGNPERGFYYHLASLVEADSVTNPFIRKHIREHRVQIYAA